MGCASSTENIPQSSSHTGLVLSDNNKLKPSSIKIVLLGDTAVGKSSIALRYCHGKFPDQHEVTVGAAYLQSNLSFYNHIYKYQIWDTGGQERFRSMAQLYYRDAKVAIVVCDATDVIFEDTHGDESTDNIYPIDASVDDSNSLADIQDNPDTLYNKDTFVDDSLVVKKDISSQENIKIKKVIKTLPKSIDYWLFELEKNGPDNVTVVIVINKIDLLNFETFEISSDIFSNNTKLNILPILACSAKTGLGVSEVFIEIAKSLSIWNN